MLSNKGRHDTTKLGPNAVQELKINQRRILIDSLEIGIPAPEQMIALGERQLPNGIKVGQLLNSKTLNYKKFTPHRDGLFCERIFGPVQSFVCACGKKKESVQNKSRQKDLVKAKLLPEGEAEVTSSLKKEALFCPKCQVEYISKNVRRHRLGYIKLFAPVTHIWYLKGRPSYLSLFLGKRKKAITSLAYCNAYLVEQVYSHLEDYQAKDTVNNEDVKKIRQNQALSAFTKTNNVKIWQNFNDQSKKKEDFKKVALEESILSSIHKRFLQPKIQFLGNESITRPRSLVKPVQMGNKTKFCSICNELRSGEELCSDKAELCLFAKRVKKRSFLKSSAPHRFAKRTNFVPAKSETAENEKTRAPLVSFNVTRAEPFFSLLKQLFPEKSVKNFFFNDKKRYARLIQPYLLTKRYKAVTKLASWLKLSPERSLDTINNRAEQSSYQDDKLSGKQTEINQSFVLTNSSKISAEKSTPKGKFLLSPYVRAQTSPFLPSLICSFHLRDCLISFLKSSPRTEDIPIPLYCQTPRRYPLRDVHKFLTEFRSTTTKKKAERLTSESIKKFTGLPFRLNNEFRSQAKPVLDKNKVFVQFDSKTKKQKIDDKGTLSTRFLPIVESSSAYIQKPNVTAKFFTGTSFCHRRSNTFTKLKVSTLAVNLEGINKVSIKKTNFLQKVIENKRNKGIGENGRFRQLKGLTKQSENLLMPIQFLARKTTISGMLLNTFIDMFLPDTASIICWLSLSRNKNHSNFTLLQNKVTLSSLLQKRITKTKLLKKTKFFLTYSFCNPFTTNVLFDKNSVQTKINKETDSYYFGKTSTNNALVKTKVLPLRYKKKHEDLFNSNLLNSQLITAGSKFRDKAKLCKKNVLFINIETYQKRLLYLVFGTLPQSQSIESYKDITKPKQSKALLPSGYSAFTNKDYSPFVKREKKLSSSSEQFFSHSVDLLKPKLIAGLYSNQNRISQYQNVCFQIYSLNPCSFLVKQKSEKGVTFLSRSHFNFARLCRLKNEVRSRSEKTKIGSNGDFTVSFSIDLPFFISGSNQNKVCLITKKENLEKYILSLPFREANELRSLNGTGFKRNGSYQVEWKYKNGVFVKNLSSPTKVNTKAEQTSFLQSNIGQTNCSVRSTDFISSSLPDASVWSCILVKNFLINSWSKNTTFSSLLPKTFIKQRYTSKVRAIPAKLQSNVVSLPESFEKSQLKGSALFDEGEAFTQTISKWHINGAKEILSYTGGGALESLLKRFNISLFCQFLLGEIQILRKYYKDQIVAEYNEKNISEVPTKLRFVDPLKNEVRAYEVGPERHFGLKYVVTDKNANLFCRRIYRTTRRLKIVQLLMRSKRRPEWMMISVLPVLPPDLRPVLQMGENLIVASDLNTLYQRVIYRNNRHYKGRFLDFHFVSSIHRLVQDAVDRLIENGKGGSTPFLTPGGRPLKSLSDILKGKRGRFRFNLLGKRVDFSGRSVIVVSPNLKIHECGLPREMALELYKYILIRKLLLKKQVSSIVNAKKLIKQRKPLIWDMLREIIYYHPLLLNRAPTLHRLGIQAFQPKLALGNAILLHPLVCAGFNADFDGDQMGVHLPLSPQARAEAWDLLWSRNNLLSPATGQPILLPSQDMVLGFYYMTALLPYGTTFRLINEDDQKITYKNNVLPAVYVFSNTFQIVNAYQKKQIDIHTPIWLKRVGKSENGEKSQIPLELRIDIFGYRTQIYPTYKSKSKVFRDRNTSFLTFNENQAFTEDIRTTVGRVLVNNLISKNN